MARLRVGVAGLGFAGQKHVKAFAAHPGCEVVALSGLDGDFLRRMALEHGVPSVHENWEELAARDDLDVMAVALPNHLHADAAVMALGSGKHVLCEKPMARNTREAEQMVAAAKDNSRILRVAFNRRYHPEVGMLRTAVASGQLGTVYHARAWWMRRTGLPGINTWYTNREKSGGGPLLDLGTHVLDMALHILGEPTAVSVSAATHNRLGSKGIGLTESQVEDFATAFIRLGNGASLQLDASWAGHTHYFNEYGVRLMGSDAGAEIRIDTRIPGSTMNLYSDAGDQSSRSGRIDGHAGVVADLFAAVTGTDTDSSDRWGEDALARMRVIEAAYRSADKGEEVCILRGSDE